VNDSLETTLLDILEIAEPTVQIQLLSENYSDATKQA